MYRIGWMVVSSEELHKWRRELGKSNLRSCSILVREGSFERSFKGLNGFPIPSIARDTLKISALVVREVGGRAAIVALIRRSGPL